jgi:hypothetical protein
LVYNNEYLKGAFNKVSLNHLSLALLAFISTSLQSFRLSIFGFDQYHYPIMASKCSLTIQGALVYQVAFACQDFFKWKF